MWAETWNMLKDRPVLGAGLSGYPTVFKPYHLAGHIEIFQYPHNIFLNFWTELGLLGVVLFLMTVALAFRRARNPAITASFIVILVHGLVDVPYFKNDLAFLFWLLIAFISSMTILRKKPD
jgi:O-antigen ligase